MTENYSIDGPFLDQKSRLKFYTLGAVFFWGRDHSKGQPRSQGSTSI